MVIKLGRQCSAWRVRRRHQSITANLHMVRLSQPVSEARLVCEEADHRGDTRALKLCQARPALEPGIGAEQHLPWASAVMRYGVEPEPSSVVQCAVDMAIHSLPSPTFYA